MSIIQNRFIEVIILLLPLIFTISNSLADLIISIIALYGIYKYFTEKIKYKELFVLIFLTIAYISVVALFSNNKFESFHSSLLLIRFPFFLLGIIKFNQSYEIKIERLSLYIYFTYAAI